MDAAIQRFGCCIHNSSFQKKFKKNQRVKQIHIKTVFYSSSGRPKIIVGIGQLQKKVRTQILKYWVYHITTSPELMTLFLIFQFKIEEGNEI